MVELNVGGILSQDGSFTLSNSYSSAEMSVSISETNFGARAGGFVAYWEDGGRLEKNYAKGSFTLTSSVSSGTSNWDFGGFIGFLKPVTDDAKQIAEAYNSYSTVDLPVDKTADNLSVGGFMARANISNTTASVFDSVYYYNTGVFAVNGTDCTTPIAANCGVAGTTDGKYAGLSHYY